MAKKAKATATNRPGKSKMPAGETLDLAGLVSYAEESIVSRTLVENTAGTITLFAFDAGQSLSEHTAPFDALADCACCSGSIAPKGLISASDRTLATAGHPEGGRPRPDGRHPHTAAHFRHAPEQERRAPSQRPGRNAPLVPRPHHERLHRPDAA